jgi:hypothetical protein
MPGGTTPFIGGSSAGRPSTARALRPHHVAAGGGDILSLASVAGLRGTRPPGSVR